MSVKREVSEENSMFNSSWEKRYSFVNNNNGKSPVSCEVASDIRYEFFIYLFKAASQHQTRKNIREIPRNF